MLRLRRAAIAFALAAQAGCVFAYSFDALHGSGPATPGGDGGDADALLPHFCAAGGAGADFDFCDDFDDDAPLGARWYVEGAFANPVLFLDASVKREPSEFTALVSPPNVIRMAAGGSRAKAALLHRLRDRNDAAARRGVEISVAARPLRFAMPDPVIGAPLTGVLIFSVLAQVDTSLGGVCIFFRDRSLYLAQTNELGDDAAPPDRATFVPLSVAAASGSAVWGRLRLVIGDRASVVARGFNCDAVDDPAAIVAAADVTLQSACMKLTGQFANTEWLARSFLALGPIVVGTAEAELLADNVTASVF